MPTGEIKMSLQLYEVLEAARLDAWRSCVDDYL
jgi:hypothetical protein